MPTRKLLASLAGLAAAIGGITSIATPAQANPAGTGLVISEVYGAGGNTGAVYNADFVELYNPTAAPVSLVGMAIHYRSATGGSGGTPYALSGTVAAGDHWLIQMSGTGVNGVALPTPNATALPAFNMATAGGQVFLLSSTTPITTTGDMAGVAGIVDMAGFATATSFETATGPAATAALSAQRSAAGADTDNNSADFSLAAPTPTPGTDTPPPPTDKTIAEIQGTGAVSPLNGQTVTTRGVVTALYPTGGFNGLYLQTAGTGGATDATPDASDGLFVFGSVGLAANPAVGDLLQVTGTVSEFAGLTEVTPSAGGVTILPDAHDPVTALVAAYPTTDAGREAHEGELLAPTNDFVVTNNFNTNTFGEVGLATGTRQLWQPTEVADALDTAAIAAAVADNAARGVILDDGASLNYTSAANQSTPMPWLTPSNPVRIGSVATLHQPVILDFRNNAWKFQPTSRVNGAGTAVATFSDTRADNLTPQNVGGDISLGALNVLNYFNTTGTDWQTSGRGTCTFFNDRTGDPVSNNSCTNNGPRGAAESTGGTDLTNPDADLERQRAKIVHAINTLDADVVSLEEVENSVALGEADRDDALASLVAALNADAGTTRWAYAASPPEAALPPLAEQDVIRTAFIYNPNTIETVGDSVVLVGSTPFNNAREPLAQAFKRKGALTADTFLVVANHFKSKGSGVDDGTGQGLANPDRIAQAQALVAFADQVAADRGTTKVFLTGDFNAYSSEDPVQAIQAAGYTMLESPDAADTSYQFGGMAGSLDHVFANADAAAMVAGFDIWRINADESVGFEYSRYNTNDTLLFQDNLFRASDHNPELVGLNAPFTTEDTLTDSTVTPTSVVVRDGVVTISSTVTGGAVTPTGTVEYWIGADKVGESVLDGTGHTAIDLGPFDTVGARTVEIRYLGDTVHTGSTDSVTFDVTKAASSTALALDPATVVVGHGTTATATVTAPNGYVPTGSVEFWVGGVKVATVPVDGTGHASAPLGPFSTVGAKAVEARYLGDATTTASNATGSVTVVKGEATVSATVSPASVVARRGRVTVDVEVTSTGPAPTGTVEFLIGGVRVASAALTSAGTAQAVLGPFAAAGDVTVEVRYLGDARTTSGTDTVSFTVTAVPTTTTLTLAPTTVVVNSGRTSATATVSSEYGAASGTVDFLVGGNVIGTGTLSGGRVTVPLGPFDTVGPVTVEARYSGTAALGSSSATAALTVKKAKPTMTVSTSPARIVVKRTRTQVKVTLTAVNQPVTGQVDVTAGGKQYSAQLVDGKVTLSLDPFASTGKKSVVVAYLGDALNEPVTKTVLVTVVS